GGRPRGALLSHRGLMAAASKQAHAWKLTASDVQVGALPLFHLAGIGITLALQAAGGSTIVLPRFDPKAVVGLIDGEGGSVIGSFPPMLGSVLDAAAAAGSKLARLRVVSGIDSPETLARFAAACPHADFWVAYGQTETSGSVSMSRYADRPGSAGLPVEQHTVALVDEQDRPVPNGTVGEIVVRGPMVFKGYWNCDEDNAFTFRGGWHHTGDMGRFDADGYLWYAGRSPAKELIKPGGENVYPAEVERALLEHPALAEAVVFGVPDAQWGEAVKAVCVLKPGQTLAAEVLIEFVGQRIARYKKPKHVVFVAALPRNPSGGLDRAAVKAAHAGT
ncbi:MAG: AMP-binding protein, partial [Burkholderiaceae bacterium]